ncbi:hypothetical protein GCM10009678_66220 [Actinomadura kijaniata]|uniref:Uncharacterized protein n=1 Tax=Actinomadura namibiensis TaxID=182080 RepID=A0A7W3LY56_ACTNM|nr:hypothetical protein [Actinomadura namibiensis]MBA8956524.1 hypothetical protein [Actinomadura namibiensis]
MRRYPYVGPAELRRDVGAATGFAVASPGDLRGWLEDRDADEPFTYVVALDGTLLLAPRRSEHVACAGGAPVLAAGEIAFADGAAVEVTNQSTGYCPDPDSWTAVAAALEAAGLAHPGGFTAAYVFRRCGACGQLNIVKDHHYFCAVCDGPLPAFEAERWRWRKLSWGTWEEQTPEGWRCAACHLPARAHTYRTERGGERCVGLSWCSNCRVYSGAMVHVPLTEALPDPLADLDEHERARLLGREWALIDHLDRRAAR